MQGREFIIGRKEIQILFFILLLIFTSFYFVQNKSILFPKPISDTDYSNRSTTKPILSNQNQVTRLDMIRCVVYVKDKLGRFGNRIFITASAYGLARLHSCHLYIRQEILDEIQRTFTPNFSSLLLTSTTFDLMMNKSNSTFRIKKHVVCEFIRELTRPNAISKGQLFELTGFWQSYLHFSKYSDEIRQNIFIGSSSVLEKISPFFVKIYEENFHFQVKFSLHYHTFKQQLVNFKQAIWIGIHVRRTDFVHLRFSSSDQYLLNAVQYYTEQYSNPYFIIASDDKSYCRNLFKNRPNIFITPDTFSIGDDLITLSLCEHSIITGGTFGWWAAFLANGQVMHDKVYPSGCEKREHYYPPWFLIDGYVRAHKNSDNTLK